MTVLKILCAFTALGLTSSFAAAQVSATQPTIVIDCVPSLPLAAPLTIDERNVTAIENVVISAAAGLELKTRYINTRYTSETNAGVEQRSTDMFIPAGQQSNVVAFLPAGESVLGLRSLAFTLLEAKSLAVASPLPVGNYPVTGALAIYPKPEKPLAVIVLSCLYKVSY